MTKTDNGDQFPKGWKPDALGKKLGGGFVRPRQRDRAPRHLDDKIAREPGSTHTVTAAARPESTESRRRRMFPPKRGGGSK